MEFVTVAQPVMKHLPSCYKSPRLTGRLLPGNAGRGVFAAAPIAAGEMLVAFGGTVVDSRTLHALSPEERRISLQIEEDLYLWSTIEGPGDWVNHSCAPNAGLRGQVILVAMRDIQTGEEICYDYAMSDGSSYDEFECMCGVPECRGWISGDDWQRPELVARYGEYFSPYLQRRIASVRASHAARPRARMFRARL